MSEKILVPPHMFACPDAKGENYVVEVELPGVKKKDVDLEMYEDVIHVHAEREDVAFHGHLHFPVKVDPKKSTAEFSNGLLKVKVLIKERPKPPTKVEVK